MIGADAPSVQRLLLPFRVAPSALLEVGNARIETVETLLEVGRYLVIFLAARALAELMARLKLPTILGELVAGVLIGVSGLHLILPPDVHVQLSQGMLSLIGSCAGVSPEASMPCCSSPAWRVNSMS